MRNLVFLGFTSLCMNKELAQAVVNKMLEKDEFSRWMGIEPIEILEGSVIIKMSVKKEMLNGFGIMHGGAMHALADSALAFAANTHGWQSVSVETSMSHMRPAHQADVITAKAIEMSRTRSIAVYQVSIKNQQDDLIALFRGTVYRTKKEWDIS